MSGALRRLLVSAVALLALRAPAAELELGVWVPRVLTGDPVSRAEWAQRAGDALGAASGITIRGRAFSTFEDLTTFASSGRLALALVDPLAVLALADARILAQGTGAEGPTPRLAVLTRTPQRGVLGLAGRPLGVARTTGAEPALLTHLAFGGQLDASTFFGARQEGELEQVAEWVRAGRVEAMVAYEAQAPLWGLHVAAPLERLALPILVELGGRLTEVDRVRLEAALRGDGVPLTATPAGVLGRLQALSRDYLAAVRRAVDGGGGPQRPVWAPGRTLTLEPNVPLQVRRAPPLEPPRGRLRLPDFPEVETGGGP